MSKSKLEQYDIEVSNIMSTNGGRGVMFNILQSTGVEFDTFNADPYRHAHTSGKRAVGLLLKSDLQRASLDLYNKMVKEHEH